MAFKKKDFKFACVHLKLLFIVVIERLGGVMSGVIIFGN